MTSRSKKPLGRFDSRTKPNLDLLVGKATLLSIGVYIVLYKLLNASAQFSFRLHWYYAFILLPIWLIDGFKSCFEVFASSHYRSADEDIGKVTVVIACKDGEHVIGQTLDSLLKRFSRHQIIVVSNGSTDGTRQVALSKGVRCLDITEPLGKVRAINRGLKYVNTKYVLLLDDDTLVGKARIPTGLLDQGYGGVAFRVLVKTSTWITYFQAYEYRKCVDVAKRFNNKRASVQNISGAIGLFTLEELKRQVKLHSAEFAGEDLQRTLLIYLSNNSKGIVLSHSTVYTIPPNTFIDLFKQRVYGWFPGLYASFPNYVRLMFSDAAPVALKVDAFYNSVLVMFFDIFRLLSLPIMIIYPWYFVEMYLFYVFLEFIAYYRSGADDPYWVLLLYPLYGLFGFITRVCAFTVLMYRRLVSIVANKDYFDDYRSAHWLIKCVSICAIVAVFSIGLISNDYFNYTRHILDYKF